METQGTGKYMAEGEISEIAGKIAEALANGNFKKLDIKLLTQKVDKEHTVIRAIIEKDKEENDNE